MVDTEIEQIHMPSIGEEAPPFTVETTQGTINFPDDFCKYAGRVQRNEYRIGRTFYGQHFFQYRLA